MSSEFKYDVFLSHSSKDKSSVLELASRLKDARLRVWLDDWEINPPDMIAREIEQGLEASRTLVLVMSQNSLASEWVTLERYTVLFRDPTNRERRFIPLRLDDVNLPDLLKQFKYVDWRQKSEDEFKKLVAACRGLPTLSPAIPDDVGRRIKQYQESISRADFVTAFSEFFERPNPEESLHYLLDFRFNRCDEHLNLISRLFANGIEKDPPGLSIQQRAKALNALGRAYKNTGKLGRAIETFRRQIRAERPSGETGVQTLTNFMNALRLAGQLREATEWGIELLRLLQGRANTSIAYSVYWRGIVAGVRGCYREAEELLRQAEVAFEHIASDHERGLGRTLAHLAQLELWLGNPRLAGCLARRSQESAQSQFGEDRELIFTNRLMGMAELMSEDCLKSGLKSGELLRSASEAAREVGYFEEQFAAAIGLAELEHRSGNRENAEEILRNVEGRAQDGGYLLLRVDALNTLSKVLSLDGRRTMAVEAAQTAYVGAWCDGPPYAYDFGLRTAQQLLDELGAELPPVGQSDALPDDERRLEKARLRCEFFGFLRVIKGHYRYALTKFVKLLREEWEAVCQIVSNQHATLQLMPPQHVEIHVGEPCQLSCLYCRGELRETPDRKERFLSRAALKDLVSDIHGMNPDAFIRFSGVIGEPLLHPSIVEVFNFVSAAHGERKWGVTTNGLGLDDKVQQAVMKAKYVHVSLDAGSDRTYQLLKKGRPGDFEKVLTNLEAIVRTRADYPNRPEVIVSVLLQTENFRELMTIGRRLKNIGVDSLEVKMQHFDKRRLMSERNVRKAYSLLDEVRCLDDGCFRVVGVQEKEEDALRKVRRSTNHITFSRCYANELGLNATVDPSGTLQSCCQYFEDQRTQENNAPKKGTLGPQGSINSMSLDRVWKGGKRMRILQSNPRDKCVNCSPSDEFVNRFVDFLRQASEVDKDFLSWVEKQIKLSL